MAILTVWQSVFLGALQGVTEFLPISSSGHLVLAERLLHVSVANDHMFDVILHAGSLIALLVYFRRDLWRLVRGFFTGDRDAYREIGYLLVGTIPAVFVGYFWGDWMDRVFRTYLWTGVWLIVTGLLLLVADRAPTRDRPLTLNKAWWIGWAQALAIIPALSRSGATIASGQMLGLSRERAARFSFLLAIPALAGATALTVWQLRHAAIAIPSVTNLLVGFVTSLIVSLASLAWLIRYVSTHRLTPFAWYLFAVGGIIVGASFIFAW